MPEGPSIVILKEELKPFKGKKVLEVSGNTSVQIDDLVNMKVQDFRTWGKHFLICFKNFFFRIHFLLWGTYRINERKDATPRLSLRFKNGEVNFYTCSIRRIEGNPDDFYDWESDVMADEWNAAKAEKKLKEMKKVNVSDALLNQEIFSGVGNIIKNEVLFRIKVHPGSQVEALPKKKLKEMIKEARNYSFDFYNWKKAFELKKNWLIYKKKKCPRCNIPSEKAYIGKTKRLTFFCNNCQALFG
jgi:endonuclease-8